MSDKFNNILHRVNWPDYFMGIVNLVKERSTCLRRQVAAILVKDNRILATGYNGAPSGVAHCQDIGCLRQTLNIPSGERHELCRGVHAEQNAIIQAATSGTSVKGADLYCTNMPCLQCAKMLINCGVKTIYYVDGYPDELALDMLREGGVEIRQMKDFYQIH